MVPLATSPRRTDGRPAVPWWGKTTGFAAAPWGRAQPVVFHDQSVGIAARRKTPKRSAPPSRLDENAFFLLTKKTPYKGWGEGWRREASLDRRPSSGASRHLLPRAGEGVFVPLAHP